MQFSACSCHDSRSKAESTITFTVLDYFYADNSSCFDGNPRFRFLFVIDGSSLAHTQLKVRPTRNAPHEQNEINIQF